MIDHHDQVDNTDRPRDEADASESSADDKDAADGSYYYDDSTGYEIYEADDEESEE